MKIPAPRAFVFSTGTEITEGLYADTNAQQISIILKNMGFQTIGHRAARDVEQEIRSALGAVLPLADLVVCTGGIGPTEDDLNREIVADLIGSKLRWVHRAEVLLRQRFARRQRQLPEENLKQNYVPEGSIPLLNFWGTATGFFVPPAPGRAGILVMPGVPKEWQEMMGRYFPGLVQNHYPVRPRFHTETIHMVMVPESEINRRLKPYFTAYEDVVLALLAKRGHVRIRITAEAETEEAAKARAEEIRQEILPLLPGENILSIGEESLEMESRIISDYRAAGKRIALAESITGGGIAKRLTDVPGASEVLELGLVTYTNEQKSKILGVPEEIFSTHGAVSSECVVAMCRGLLERSEADVVLAISGFAGPTGGDEKSPVGTVWIGLGRRDSAPIRSEVFHNPGNRQEVRAWAENQALNLLRTALLTENS